MGGVSGRRQWEASVGNVSGRCQWEVSVVGGALAAAAPPPHPLLPSLSPSLPARLSRLSHGNLPGAARPHSWLPTHLGFGEAHDVFGLGFAELRKLWYTKARGDHDKVWILEGWGWGCSGWGWGPCA